jgi:hypothetical protein
MSDPEAAVVKHYKQFEARVRSKKTDFGDALVAKLNNQIPR